jgi:hypothetical protein
MTPLFSPVLIPAGLASAWQLRPGFSLAELTAARLDGEVVALDECFLTLDTPRSPETCGASLRAIVGDHAVAESVSALWIYGLVHSPPRIHTVCIDRQNRASTPHNLRVAVRETRFLPGDIVRIGGMAVTTPIRTVYDLLRAERFTGIERGCTRALIDRFELDEDACRTRLEAVSNLPGRSRALIRLNDLAR